MVVRAIKLPGETVDPSINFNLDSIGNLKQFDPYAFSLLNADALNLNFGEFGLLGNFSGSVAGYSQASGIRNEDSIISYSPPSSGPSLASSSTSLVDILKSLTEAGNKGNILDFFKNLNQSNSQNITFVKSIEVLSGSEIQSEGNNSSSSTNDQCIAEPEINFEVDKDC